MTLRLFHNKPVSQYLPCLGICMAAFIYALVQAIRTCNGQWDGMIAAMLLAIAIVYFGFTGLFSDNTPLAKPTMHERNAAWVLIIVSPLITFLFSSSSSDLPHFLALSLLAIASVLFFYGTKAAIKMAPALVIFCVFIPMREQFILMVSYPLRLISTIASVQTLQLFGYDIQHKLTTITLPGTEIVITDACSGIQQFEALLFVSYIIIKLQPKPFVWSICQYLFLLPVIIISNSCRIIVTILLYGVIGTRVLNNTWHTAFGYCLVFACSLLIWFSGLLFPNKNTSSAREEKHNI